MNSDYFKHTWHMQTSPTDLTLDAQVLLQEVRRKQECFTAAIFWRDVREVGTGLLMVPLWIYLGVKFSLPWTWYLMVPGLVWIAGYMLADRMRHQRQSPEPGESPCQRLESSLAQVRHQVWLLRHVLWWYLLPLAIPMLAFIGQVTWQERSGGWWTVVAMATMVTLQVVCLVGVYWLNQKAVRSELEPRRQELESLLMSFKDEAPAAAR